VKALGAGLSDGGASPVSGTVAGPSGIAAVNPDGAAGLSAAYSNFVTLIGSEEDSAASAILARTLCAAAPTAQPRMAAKTHVLYLGP
jgi:hypothetical protein